MLCYASGIGFVDSLLPLQIEEQSNNNALPPFTLDFEGSDSRNPFWKSLLVSFLGGPLHASFPPHLQ